MVDERVGTLVDLKGLVVAIQQIQQLLVVPHRRFQLDEPRIDPIHLLLQLGAVDPERVAATADGFAELAALWAGWTPERVCAFCGIERLRLEPLEPEPTEPEAGNEEVEPENQHHDEEPEE